MEKASTREPRYDNFEVRFCVEGNDYMVYLVDTCTYSHSNGIPPTRSVEGFKIGQISEGILSLIEYPLEEFKAINGYYPRFRCYLHHRDVKTAVSEVADTLIDALKTLAALSYRGTMHTAHQTANIVGNNVGIFQT